MYKFDRFNFREFNNEYNERQNKKHLFCKCKKCSGTGLKNFKFSSYWTGEFCDKCNGQGLFYFFEIIKNGYDLNDFYSEDELND